jgi:hypothetical protein
LLRKSFTLEARLIVNKELLIHYAKKFAEECNDGIIPLNEHSQNFDSHIFLVDDTPVGGVVFGTYFLPPNDYFLDWIWIEPEHRRKGLLKTAWPGFVEKYGDFAVSLPLTPMLKKFLLEYGTERQKGLTQLGIDMKWWEH